MLFEVNSLINLDKVIFNVSKDLNKKVHLVPNKDTLHLSIGDILIIIPNDKNVSIEEFEQKELPF